MAIFLMVRRAAYLCILSDMFLDLVGWFASHSEAWIAPNNQVLFQRPPFALWPVHRSEWDVEQGDEKVIVKAEPAPVAGPSRRKGTSCPSLPCSFLMLLHLDAPAPKAGPSVQRIKGTFLCIFWSCSF